MSFNRSNISRPFSVPTQFYWSQLLSSTFLLIIIHFQSTSSLSYLLSTFVSIPYLVQAYVTIGVDRALYVVSCNAQKVCFVFSNCGVCLLHSLVRGFLIPTPFPSLLDSWHLWIERNHTSITINLSFLQWTLLWRINTFRIFARILFAQSCLENL